MMLVSTPTKHSIQHRSPTCDSGMSPYYQRHRTPSRFTPENGPFDPPVLSSPPLRQRPLFPTAISPKQDADDLFTSPFKSIPRSVVLSKPQPISADDEEGSIFLSTPASPPVQPSGSHSSLSPAKQAHRSSLGRFALKPLNTGFSTTAAAAHPATPDPGAGIGVGAGIKRKSAQSTPLRQHQHQLTPLKVESWTTTNREGKTNILFDRLAPLPTPQSAARTPQSKAETEAHLRRQTATLTRLRITDRDDSGDDYNSIADDSGCEMDDDEGNTLFLSSATMKSKVKSAATRWPASKVKAGKGKGKEEVAEVISPGGHVTKRRARSRPVSAELKQSVRLPKSPVRGVAAVNTSTARAKVGSSVAFPSYRTRTSSSSSTSEAGSPRPRRRINAAATRIQPSPPRPIPPPNSTDQPLSPRPPLSRLESVSSATLFFGPAIPSPTKPPSRSSTNTLRSPESRKRRVTNRHSYAGPGTGDSSLQAWNTIQAQLPSPASSPLGDAVNTDMEDMDFEDTPPNSSFVFNVTATTPSPERKTALQKKYKPHDSGVVFSDDDGSLFPSHGNNSGNKSSPAGGDFLLPLARSSNSGDSISVFSDGDDGLVTPGAGPGSDVGWPDEGVFVRGADDNRRALLEGGAEAGDVDVDAFIMRTLASAANGPHEITKRVPGTPVKKVRTTFLGSERPWQSAVATKVGPRLEFDDQRVNAPRKSLPAAFPALQKRIIDDKLGDSTDSEGEEDSPSTRKDSKYAGLGLGRPMFDAVPFALSRTRWLMRRSSSGAFSSGSDSASVANTPTRGKPTDWQLSKPHIPAMFSQSQLGTLKLSPVRSASGSSNSSTVTISPTDRSRYLVSSGVHRAAPRTSSAARRSELTVDGESGRFEREFLELAEVGSGEFGKVIKVRRKDGDDAEVFAIKKSKRFEGTKHRLRLREEVDILKHLSQATFANGLNGRHPNVLAYIDSWEEDEALFIQTELCDLGNLARFLWEYGRVFPRLDEARVWKIIADLSNGLRFIHDAGVIHLDIKPSNVFLTKEGRFKIGDFGMASLWPRPAVSDMSGSRTSFGERSGFEREGDKLYLAPEVLQGRYGKEADVFSLGMTILETASNIVVPDQGDAWHRLRREDFSQVDLQDLSEELVGLITQMMRSEPASRIGAHGICVHPVVSRAKEAMERLLAKARQEGKSEFTASPLASVSEGFLEEILGRASSEREWGMDVSP